MTQTMKQTVWSSVVMTRNEKVDTGGILCSWHINANGWPVECRVRQVGLLWISRLNGEDVVIDLSCSFTNSNSLDVSVRSALQPYTPILLLGGFNDTSIFFCLRMRLDGRRSMLWSGFFAWKTEIAKSESFYHYSFNVSSERSLSVGVNAN